MADLRSIGVAALRAEAKHGLAGVLAAALHQQSAHRNRATCGPRHHMPLAERLLEALEARGYQLVSPQVAAVASHVGHGEVLAENELLRDALRHLLAVARDVDRSMRDVDTERCDDCHRLPGEGHDDDCGLDGLASGADYVLALLRGRVALDLPPTSVGENRP